MQFIGKIKLKLKNKLKWQENIDLCLHKTNYKIWK